MLKAITIYHLVHLLKNLLSLDDKGAMNRQLSRDGRRQCSMVNALFIYSFLMVLLQHFILHDKNI